MEENYSKSIQESKYNNITKRTILFLTIICFIGLVIRFYYTPYGIPVNFDAFAAYFLYALDISILKDFPNYTISQSGWPEFLSLFFMNFHSDNLIDYMNLQRTISVILSGITVIPIYFICKKFFNTNYSLLGALIFAFDPRIINNSTLGVTEPLYILAITLAILLFLNVNQKIIFLSFGFFAWATIIRPEGQFWFLAFSIIYFLRFRKNRKNLALFLICLGIFLLVLSPIVMHRIEVSGDDGIVSRIVSELRNYNNNSIQSNNETNIVSYGPNFFNGIKLFVWSLIPILIIFVPIGLIPILKQLQYPNYVLLLVPTILAIPIMYSVSIAPDTRYVFVLFPIFCVISLFGIKYIVSKFVNKKFILLLIISIIIISSMLFLDFKKIQYGNSHEAYIISKLMINDVNGVNKSSKVVEFFKIAEIEKKWSSSDYSGNLKDNYDVNRFLEWDFKSVKEFINFYKDEKLTHLIIDQSEHMPEYMKEVLNNETKYQYLIKEFDSAELGYNYHVKLYKINYEIFEKLER